MARVTRKEAAARLRVSKSTLDRMIKRGELITETEPHGQKHTVWVLMDDTTEDITEVSTDNTNGHLAEGSEYTGDDTTAEILVLRAENVGLRELVDVYKDRLNDSDWRYQQLLDQFKALTNALPMAMATEEPPRPKRRRWWPFR